MNGFRIFLSTLFCPNKKVLSMSSVAYSYLNLQIFPNDIIFSSILLFLMVYKLVENNIAFNKKTRESRSSWAQNSKYSRWKIVKYNNYRSKYIREFKKSEDWNYLSCFIIKEGFHYEFSFDVKLESRLKF